MSTSADVPAQVSADADGQGTRITTPPESTSPSSSVQDSAASKNASDPTPKTGIRRFSFLLFFSAQRQTPKLTKPTREQQKDPLAKGVFAKSGTSGQDKRALESALLLRTLIVGPSDPALQGKPPPTIPQFRKAKTQLLRPQTANKVILYLRSFPSSGPIIRNGGNDACRRQGPIHAVCLEHSDEEMDTLHFATLSESERKSIWSLGLPGVSSTALTKLTELFNNLHIVDLIRTPDLGFGQPGDAPGLLAGAVPSAETVMRGIEQITPQLMALGYATGKAILPDHSGVYPPKDRMSVLTYWWGYELALPPPSIAYLARVQSIPDTLINILTALALMNDGIREILPFVRYIAQYIDYQFKAIQAQDQGNGVVCAATWIMPVALVVRPWDFPDPPANGGKPANPPNGGNPTQPPSGEKPPTKPADPPNSGKPAKLAESTDDGVDRTSESPPVTSLLTHSPPPEIREDN